MTKTKTILVCPLDWGLGHATRMVPVINLLLQQGARVIIGADNRPMAYLASRFPACEHIRFPGFSPHYPASGRMALYMMKAFGAMQKEAKKANRYLQQLITEKSIDIVISDNRYELYSSRAYTVFVTHQLNLQTPGYALPARPLIRKIIRGYIKKYNELWIPDVASVPNLSGKLSHIKKMPVDAFYFIGPLSRFSLINKKSKIPGIDLLIMLSGPEPQRTLLEQKLVEQALKTNYVTVLLQGKPEMDGEQQNANVRIIPHAGDETIAAMIASAKYMVCRPGYSTLMDLAILGHKSVFIPTPGQTEQEYLAHRLKKAGIAYSESQAVFSLQEAIRQQVNFTNPLEADPGNVLLKRVEALLNL